MWMMTTIGFYSIIEKQKQICVRSRKKADLKAFRKLIEGCGPIIKTPRADYRYRIFMQREQFEKEFVKLAKLISYNNFKNEVAKTNKSRETIYHRVWVDLLAIETEDIVYAPIKWEEDEILSPIEAVEIEEVEQHKVGTGAGSVDESILFDGRDIHKSR